jgi:hypothetical protein
LPLGTVSFEQATNEHGQRYLWLESRIVDRLRSLRGDGEDYSQVILRLAEAAQRAGAPPACSPLDHDERRIPVGRRHERSIEARKFAAKTLTGNDPTAHFGTFALEQPQRAIFLDKNPPITRSAQCSASPIRWLSALAIGITPGLFSFRLGGGTRSAVTFRA